MTMLKRFVEEELASHHRARRDSHTADAWTALERAHVLSQPDAWLHTRVHLAMLRFAIGLGDWMEVRGQVARIAVAGIGSLLGKAPRGNTGRATVPIMAVMPLDPEIAVKLAEAGRGRKPTGYHR